MHGRFAARVPKGGAGLVTSAHVAQLAEHVLGKDEVTGSIPVIGSSSRNRGDERRTASGDGTP